MAKKRQKVSAIIDEINENPLKLSTYLIEAYNKGYEKGYDSGFQAGKDQERILNKALSEHDGLS